MLKRLGLLKGGEKANVEASDPRTVKDRRRAEWPMMRGYDQTSLCPGNLPHGASVSAGWADKFGIFTVSVVQYRKREKRVTR